MFLNKLNLQLVITLANLQIFSVISYGKVRAETLSQNKYEANWASLDSRPLPEWYDQNKIGIFIHWSLFSVPSHLSAWFWYYWITKKDPRFVSFMEKNYKPGFTYADFAPMFTAEFYDPDYWANVFRRAGARYVVLTNKHHEGFALWPSPYGFNWNSVDVGPRRDLLGDLATAVRKTGLRFGVYNSLMEWYQPSFEADMANNCTTRDFVLNKVIPTLKELVTRYQPDVIWSDGDWGATSKYWGSEDFLAWLYNESPVKNTVVTNDRWGSDTYGKHGGYYNFADRFNPGFLMKHKWENAMTLDKNGWVHRRDAKAEDYLTPAELISQVVSTVACGGNILVNIGPTKEGILPPIMEERLLQMGKWLSVNGEAIYNSVPWLHQNDTVTPNIWYTTNQNRTKVYAIATKWSGQKLVLGAVNSNLVKVQSVGMLGFASEVKWLNNGKNGIKIQVPPGADVYSKWAWTFVINV